MPHGRQVSLQLPAIRPESAELGHWLAELHAILKHIVRRVRTGIGALVQRVRTVTPEQWFLVGFVLLFVAYAFILITAPSAVGRGGR